MAECHWKHNQWSMFIILLWRSCPILQNARLILVLVWKRNEIGKGISTRRPGQIMMARQFPLFFSTLPVVGKSANFKNFHKLIILIWKIFKRLKMCPENLACFDTVQKILEWVQIDFAKHWCRFWKLEQKLFKMRKDEGVNKNRYSISDQN